MKKESEGKPEKKPEKKTKKKSYRGRKCKCCHEMFMPQPHNAYHQRFCTAPFCRLASKRESARRFFAAAGKGTTPAIGKGTTLWRLKTYEVG